MVCKLGGCVKGKIHPKMKIVIIYSVVPNLYTFISSIEH